MYSMGNMDSVSMFYKAGSLLDFQTFIAKCNELEVYGIMNPAMLGIANGIGTLKSSGLIDLIVRLTDL